MTDKKRALLNDLREYQPANEQEAESHAFILDFLATELQPFSRKTLRGHVTASAYVVDAEYRNVLMVWHRKLGRWLQPGGHIEEDDPSVYESARREVLEETGYSAIPSVLGSSVFDVDVHEIPPQKTEAEHLHLDIRYLFVAGNEVGDADHKLRWQPLEEHGEDYDPATVRALHKIAMLRE